MHTEGGPDYGCRSGLPGSEPFDHAGRCKAMMFGRGNGKIDSVITQVRLVVRRSKGREDC